MSFEGKNLVGNWQMDRILIILKETMATGLHLPLYWDYFPSQALEVMAINHKVYIAIRKHAHAIYVEIFFTCKN